MIKKMKCLFFKHKPNSYRKLPKESKDENEQNFRMFTLQELQHATNGFDTKLKIAEGDFGQVYRGKIRGVVVAIKKVNNSQGNEEWLEEVQFLSVLNHPNLVKLLGYCCFNSGRDQFQQRFLVYEFMPNGTLQDHLFNLSFRHLPWNTRLEIMLGVAQALQYLHNELDVQVIYRHFRSSRVLLGRRFHPKLSDFGPSMEGLNGDQPRDTCRFPLRRLAYAPPEFNIRGCGDLKVEYDTWSLGVVLYEILAGRPAEFNASRPKGEERLVQVFKKYYPANSTRFSKIIDPRLKNQYSLSAARKIAKLADRCLNMNTQDRPFMTEIVETLKKALHHSQTTTNT